MWNPLKHLRGASDAEPEHLTRKTADGKTVSVTMRVDGSPERVTVTDAHGTVEKVLNMPEVDYALVRSLDRGR